jgi:hypothetical protein
MTVIGTVRNGKIELPDDVSLPEGTSVSVKVIEPAAPLPEAATDTGRRLLKLAGTCEGLPADLSVNLDHYLYGTPKR